MWLSSRTGDRGLVPGPRLQGLRQSGEWEPGRPLAGTCALPAAWVRSRGLWTGDLPRKTWSLTQGGACSRASVDSVASPICTYSYFLIAFPGSALTPVCSRPSPLCGPATSSQLPSASLHRPPHLISLRSALRTLRHWVFRRNVAWTTLNYSRIILSAPLPGCLFSSPSHYRLDESVLHTCL